MFITLTEERHIGFCQIRNQITNSRNNEVKEIPNLNYVYGDRDEPEEFKKLLADLSGRLGICKDNKLWKLVVDFCAYNKKHVEV